ncbi:hypothetical protein BDK51DRAFT_50404 [Blyttiomyces helicus]|uniref:Uncharacterized protein n=1 Tax=Blyttiomyces helicus TaxID=388810 RepID=A0A4V1IS70_9FUNG|nr:hypothetical protein BDK51DRAFT_50404 [Blyttiomyces helicus]|eukprot:RKO92527.1 hypothetical protein BDK51DRAFT_50404 [Blyttiomyces helicus]
MSPDCFSQSKYYHAETGLASVRFDGVEHEASTGYGRTWWRRICKFKASGKHEWRTSDVRLLSRSPMDCPRIRAAAGEVGTRGAGASADPLRGGRRWVGRKKRVQPPADFVEESCDRRVCLCGAAQPACPSPLLRPLESHLRQPPPTRSPPPETPPQLLAAHLRFLRHFRLPQVTDASALSFASKKPSPATPSSLRPFDRGTHNYSSAKGSQKTDMYLRMCADGDPSVRVIYLQRKKSTKRKRCPHPTPPEPPPYCIEWSVNIEGSSGPMFDAARSNASHGS